MTSSDTMRAFRLAVSEQKRNGVVGDVLHSGCGTSALSLDLHMSEFISGKVVNIDFSDRVLAIVRRRYPDLVFQKEDARSMSLPNNRFDVIIDKGTLDAMNSDSSESMQNVTRILAEYRRVLTDSGCCLVFSLFGQDHWAPFLQNQDSWSWDVTTLDVMVGVSEMDSSSSAESCSAGIINECSRAPGEGEVLLPSEVGGEQDKEEAFLLRLFPRLDDKHVSFHEPTRASEEACADRERGGGKSYDSACLKCKARAIEYECDPCGCPSFCKKCAMKVASGGRCRLCKSMYGGVRRLRK